MACSCTIRRNEQFLPVQTNIFTISRETSQVTIPALPSKHQHRDSRLLCYSSKNGYQKLVEQPLEHSSPATVAAISEAVSSSSPLPLHHHLESANPRGDTMGKVDIAKTTPMSRYQHLLKVFVSEFLGTHLLVFFGCLGCISALSPHISPLQPGLAFGMTVCSIIQIFGHISGAHLNPAISLSAVILKKLTIIEFIVYSVAQVLGSVAGYGLLKLVTPHAVLVEDTVGDHGFCMTLPSKEITIFQAFVVEFFASSFLILVVCSAWDVRNADKHDSMPIKFGFVIVTLALCAGPYTGASMNPARSFGPAFWNGNFTLHWLYWVSPMLAAGISSGFYRFFFWQNNNQPQQVQVQLTNMRNHPNQGEDEQYSQSLV